MLPPGGRKHAKGLREWKRIETSNLFKYLYSIRCPIFLSIPVFCIGRALRKQGCVRPLL